MALCLVCSNYSSLGISDGCETEGEPVCSTEEESLLEEEESFGHSNIALRQHSTIQKDVNISLALSITVEGERRGIHVHCT